MAIQPHVASPGHKTLQVELSILLPGVDEGDGCIHRLSTQLLGHKGVSEAHVQTKDGQAVLCLHYDPNLMALDRLQQLARTTGAEIGDRYRHQVVMIRGMNQGTNTSFIEDAVGKVVGVLHVAVNYAAEKMKVEYDSQQTSLQPILEAARRLGYQVDLPASASPSRTKAGQAKHEHDGHGHGGHSEVAGDLDANWLQRNPELSQSLLCGLLGLTAFLGSKFFGFPPAVCIGLYVLAYVAGAYDLARHTLPSTLRGKFDVELLMLLAAAGAAALGEWAEGTLLLFLFSFGHALEHYALDRARSAIKALGNLTPKIARVRRDGVEVELPVEELKVGDVASVRPGDRIAVDGKIIRGNSSVDQSPITGESVPIEKVPGANVFAGSINGDGSLEVEVTKLASDTTMSRVIQMVEDAQTQKSPTQTFTDKFERVLVPSVLVTVALAAIVPPLLGLLTWKAAILRALSTLVGASPCALALATPSAVLAGIGQAARNGVLIKGGVHLENLGLLTAIALDKTGTITRGKPEVSDIVLEEGVDEQSLLGLAASVEIRSNHPLAQAIVRRAQADQLELQNAGELQNLPGRGVQSEVAGELVRIGNLKMFQEAGLSVPQEIQDRTLTLSEAGKPIMLVGHGDQVLGAIALADEIRPETSDCFKRLRSDGIRELIMLTGDNDRVAQTIAKAAGVDSVRADLLPENKVAAIQELLKEHGLVAMVGDGVNDAPALANATVGIAMGAGGTDVALETADVALMADDLSKLPFSVALSRQSRRVIQQNLFLSLGAIGLLVPATLFGFAGIGTAVVFHEGSTLLVVFNALRLLNFRP